MSMPSGSEARLIAFETPYRELVVGDEIGPADVAQPTTYIVVGVLERSSEDRFAARTPLRLQAVADGEVTSIRPIQSNTVFVRRYFATITVTRAGGAVDARKPKMWLRPVGDCVTLHEAWRLKLQPGDTISLVAA